MIFDFALTYLNPVHAPTVGSTFTIIGSDSGKQNRRTTLVAETAVEDGVVALARKPVPPGTLPPARPAHHH